MKLTAAIAISNRVLPILNRFPMPTVFSPKAFSGDALAVNLCGESGAVERSVGWV
ncbi:hypothetical protein [Thalassovita aquimarina]|uniref:hypothetical protein n=1 Tax=Thalassovita aquimarina TaxID=2785917 RepID=UPI001BAF18DA|nr:hypothetical protein [Thalassovita aquimarina]